MTKKRSSEIENFLRKVKLGKFSMESEQFFGNREKSETRGEMQNASLPQGVTGENGIEQNGTNKMVAIFIDSNSTELNFYSVTTSHK